MSERETDAELLARRKLVLAKYAEAKKRADRAKPGGTRDRQMRWCGCLNFTLSQIESELRDRGVRFA